MPACTKVITTEPVPEFLVSRKAEIGNVILLSAVAVELASADRLNTVTDVPTEGLRYVPEGSS